MEAKFSNSHKISIITLLFLQNCMLYSQQLFRNSEDTEQLRMLSSLVEQNQYSCTKSNCFHRYLIGQDNWGSGHLIEKANPFPIQDRDSAALSRKPVMEILHLWETWPSNVKDVKKVYVTDHQSLLTIFRAFRQYIILKDTIRTWWFSLEM